MKCKKCKFDKKVRKLNKMVLLILTCMYSNEKCCSSECLQRVRLGCCEISLDCRVVMLKLFLEMRPFLLFDYMMNGGEYLNNV